MAPSKPGDPQKGKPAQDEKTEAAAAEAKEAAAKEGAATEAASGEAPSGEAAEPKPKSRRRRAAPSGREAGEAGRAARREAEETAAAQTGVGKDAAEAALQEGAGEPVAAEEEPAAAEEPAAPARRTRPDRRRRGRPEGGLVTVRAHAKYVRTSARKARLVCDHIRGKSVEEARAILAHTPRAVARDWSKLLESAVANAEHNHELVGDELRIHSVTADEGPTLKRFRPRAYGRATRIRKRTSHHTITLTPKE
jgi:ribosomal protein L22